MPVRSLTPCRQTGCSALLDKPGYCVQHKRMVYKAQKRQASTDYTERNRFYQRKAWKNLRALHLAHEPLCRACRTLGRLTAAQVVDHITPISQGGAALDDNNLQSLCKSCHNAKTLQESLSNR
jgi:5-methylcytosine-specific restriction protein A